MAENSKIEWTDDTVNPWWGCTKVSPACTHCYAETFAKRTGRAKWGPSSPRWVRIDAAKRDLRKSIRLARKESRPRRVFMCSMADIFEEHPDLTEPRLEWWAFLHEVAEERLPDGRPCVIPLILTKRPEVMARFAAEHGWPENAWAGCTVEDQKRADERIPHLLRVPAPVRFLSCEPLLGPVRLRPDWIRQPACPDCGGMLDFGTECPGWYEGGESTPWPTGLDWLIIGGESGSNARPMHPDWARSLIRQGQEAGVAIHFKQWGEWAPMSVSKMVDIAIDEGRQLEEWELSRWHETHYSDLLREMHSFVFSMFRLGKKAAGRVIDGRTWDEVPNG